MSKELKEQSKEPAADRMVLQRLANGHWTAAFVGAGPFTAVDVARISRLLELTQRTWALEYKKRLADARGATNG